MNRDNNYFNKLYWLKDKKKSGGGILIHHAIPIIIYFRKKTNEYQNFY